MINSNVFWIKVKNSSTLKAIFNSSILGQLRKESIYEYGKANSYVFNDFFSDKKSFWVHAKTDDDIIELIEIISEEFSTPVLAYWNHKYVAFNSIGKRILIEDDFSSDYCLVASILEEATGYSFNAEEYFDLCHDDEDSFENETYYSNDTDECDNKQELCTPKTHEIKHALNQEKNIEKKSKVANKENNILEKKETLIFTNEHKEEKPFTEEILENEKGNSKENFDSFISNVLDSKIDDSQENTNHLYDELFNNEACQTCSGSCSSCYEFDDLETNKTTSDFGQYDDFGADESFQDDFEHSFVSNQTQELDYLDDLNKDNSFFNEYEEVNSDFDYDKFFNELLNKSITDNQYFERKDTVYSENVNNDDILFGNEHKEDDTESSNYIEDVNLEKIIEEAVEKIEEASFINNVDKILEEHISILENVNFEIASNEKISQQEDTILKYNESLHQSNLESQSNEYLNSCDLDKKIEENIHDLVDNIDSIESIESIDKYLEEDVKNSNEINIDFDLDSEIKNESFISQNTETNKVLQEETDEEFISNLNISNFDTNFFEDLINKIDSTDNISITTEKNNLEEKKSVYNQELFSVALDKECNEKERKIFETTIEEKKVSDDNNLSFLIEDLHKEEHQSFNVFGESKTKGQEVPSFDYFGHEVLVNKDFFRLRNTNSYKSNASINNIEDISANDISDLEYDNFYNQEIFGIENNNINNFSNIDNIEFHEESLNNYDYEIEQFDFENYGFDELEVESKIEYKAKHEAFNNLNFSQFEEKLIYDYCKNLHLPQLEEKETITEDDVTLSFSDIEEEIITEESLNLSNIENNNQQTNKIVNNDDCIEEYLKLNDLNDDEIEKSFFESIQIELPNIENDPIIDNDSLNDEVFSVDVSTLNSYFDGTNEDINFESIDNNENQNIEIDFEEETQKIDVNCLDDNMNCQIEHESNNINDLFNKIDHLEDDSLEKYLSNEDYINYDYDQINNLYSQNIDHKKYEFTKTTISKLEDKSIENELNFSINDINNSIEKVSQELVNEIDEEKINVDQNSFNNESEFNDAIKETESDFILDNESEGAYDSLISQELVNEIDEEKINVDQNSFNNESEFNDAIKETESDFILDNESEGAYDSLISQEMLNNVEGDKEKIDNSNFVNVSIELPSREFKELHEKNKKISEDLSIFLDQLKKEKEIISNREEAIINREKKLKEILNADYSKNNIESTAERNWTKSY